MLLRVLLLISLCYFCSAIVAESKNYTVMAAGGSLKTCSSLSVSNCADDVVFNIEVHKTAEHYHITDDALTAMEKSSTWRFKEQQELLLLVHLLKELKSQIPRALTRREFVDKFRGFSVSKTSQFPATNGELFYANMTDYDWYKMLDYFQQKQSYDSVRKQERVHLSASKTEATSRVFRAFVNMAQQVSRKNKPLVLVMTSSARDPYDAVDFYLQVFEQAGANTTWLPLEQALNKAITTKQCDKLDHYRDEFTGSVRRSEVYPDLASEQRTYCESPDLLLSLIKQADGIFINGGDQSLTRATLIPDDESAFMKLIRDQVNAGELVIGGTSAGAAVQSGRVINDVRIPMISSGQSYTALVHGAFSGLPPAEGCEKNNSCGELPEGALTFHPDGGLGVINTGLIDTHFSERGRQVRLMQLAAETNTPIAVGVDETTAVMISENGSNTTYEVVGKNGVWFFENAQLKSDDDLLESKAHYLTESDTLTINKSTAELKVTFGGIPSPQEGTLEVSDVKDILYRDSLKVLSVNFAQADKKSFSIKTRETAPGFTITMSKLKSFITTQSLLDNDQLSKLTSFQDLYVEIELNK